MIRITNNFRSPVYLPGESRLIEPNGGTLIVSRAKWDETSRSPVVQAWLKRGLLRADPVDAPAPAAAEPDADASVDTEAAAPEPLSEAQEKDALIAELARHGIQRDRRTSLQRLRDLLADARAEAAP